ncbi:replication initiator protein A [Vescimonas sp.]|uniref:replication initiator protein A n=1 Tax=Vescimonas sp. TaxID=2892404 RepID=UPI0030783C05
MNPHFPLNYSEHFNYYRLHQLLFTDEIYQTVSTDAKMLYGLLLDRLSLSEKNDWKDEHGRVYQYFTIHQAQELLHFGHEKVCRLFAELDAADLIVRRRQGQGKANRIYLKEFTQKSDFRNSRSPGIGRK